MANTNETKHTYCITLVKFGTPTFFTVFDTYQAAIAVARKRADTEEMETGRSFDAGWVGCKETNQSYDVVNGTWGRSRNARA